MDEDRDRVASLVLAAGEGQRFGGCKQLAILDGRPLLEHALDGARGAGTSEVVVVLGSRARRIESSIDLTDVRVVHAEDWQRGPQASLAAGLAAIEGSAAAALVTLGDEVGVPAGAAGRLLAGRRAGGPGIRAVYHGRPGHPVLIERTLFRRLVDAGPTSTKPARILREAGIVELECGDLGTPVDVDTPLALARVARGD